MGSFIKKQPAFWKFLPVLLVVFTYACKSVVPTQQNHDPVQQNQAPQYPENITVAQDGSGDYTTIQAAIDAIRPNSPTPNTINIKKGLYKEKILVPETIVGLTIVGESETETIIRNGDYIGKYIFQDTVKNNAKITLVNSYTVQVLGNDIAIKNLTIQNNTGKVGKGVALHVAGDRFLLQDCRLLANQHTLYTSNDNSRQFYYNCHIEGTTDFIFGPATAIFQNCTIKSLSDSYITAASTPSNKKYGYLFRNCTLTASEDAIDVYLGRAVYAHARTVFMYCAMGAHINPQGWYIFKKPEIEKSVFFAEYGNSGQGANTSQRVVWSKQLGEAEASDYATINVLNGWVPKLGQVQ